MKIESAHEIKYLEGPDMGVLNGDEGIPNMMKALLVFSEINVVASLEVDLDKNETLVVFTLDGFEEAATTKNLFQD